MGPRQRPHSQSLSQSVEGLADHQDAPVPHGPALPEGAMGAQLRVEAMGLWQSAGRVGGGARRRPLPTLR